MLRTTSGTRRPARLASSTLGIFALGLAFLAFVVAGCERPSLPAAALAPLEGATSFELLALDPKELTDEQLEDVAPRIQRWAVTKTVDVATAEDRRALVAALKRGVAESDGTVAACFNPRHALRVTYQGTTYEFVLCFECLSGKWGPAGGGPGGGFVMTNSPKGKFDEVLNRLPAKSP